MKLLKFNQNFEVEKLLKDTKYPLSKNQFKICNEIIKIKEPLNNENLNEFIDKLDLLIKKRTINVITMKYCKDINEREKFKVYIYLDKLCIYSNENKTYTPISSVNLFKKYFNGRTPKEDDEYLIKIKYPILPERIGKSTCSCFIIDKSNNLYINPYRQDTIQHSFITDCEDLLSAGLIYCENGKILYIETRAGHYLPNPKNILCLFNCLKIENASNNLNNLFHQDFDIKRENFSKCQTDIINKKEYGLNFFNFKEKTKQEIKSELQIRNLILGKYLNN